MGEVRYMISEAAKKVQVESHVLRYWEEELGLEIGRTDMGHRYYTEDDIQLFLCIQKLKNEGMLLRDLKPMIPELTATRKRLNAARAEKQAQSALDSKADAPSRSETGGRAKAAANSASGSTAGERTPAGSTAAAGEKNLASARAATGKNALSDAPADADGTSANEDDRTHGVSPSKSPQGAAQPPEKSYDPTGLTASGTEVIQMTQLEQVRSLIGDVLTDVVSANNETLKKDISRKVTADVIREMDFLFQANERREEEHFRKLDMLIRQQQASRRETAKATPIGKLKKLLT